MIALLMTFLGKVASDVLKIFFKEAFKPQKSRTMPNVFKPEELGVNVRLSRLLDKYGKL